MTMTRRRGRRDSGWATVPALALLTGILALSGCGQPTAGDPDDTVAPTVEVPVQPTLTAHPPETSTPSAPVSAAGPGGLFDASQSLTDVTCAATGRTWSFTATLTNSDADAHEFTVAVAVVRTSDSSELVSKEIVVPLAAGASAPVTADAFWTGPSTGVECLTGATVKEDD
ncbi:hypothetical protein [Terracoccus luteus]|nr:hypothetical protein [Terracoccus luteus]MCP2173671.1 hypothetical protein [Terracoccus luteus]